MARVGSKKRKKRRLMKADATIAITSISKVFAPSFEKCKIKYSLKRKKKSVGKFARLEIKDKDRKVLLSFGYIGLAGDGNFEFLWDGKDDKGKYVDPIRSPYSVSITMTNNARIKAKKKTKVEIESIDITVYAPDNETFFKKPDHKVRTAAKVKLKKSDGGGVLTKVPLTVAFSLPKKYVDKKKAHVFWEARPGYATVVNGTKKNKCSTDVKVKSGKYKGIAKVYFKPEDVEQELEVKAAVYAADSKTILAEKLCSKFKVLIRHDIKGQLYWNRTWSYKKAGAIAAKKTFLRNCKVVYYAGTVAGKEKRRKGSYTAKDGIFEFKSVPAPNGYIKIYLKHKGRKVTKLVGNDNKFAGPPYELKTGKLVWGQVKLDKDKLKVKDKAIDLGEVEITHSKFRDACEVYNLVCYGHKRIVALTGTSLPLVEVRLPTTGGQISHYSAGKLKIDLVDVRQRSVILHEYAHFISANRLGPLVWRGYGYNNDVTKGHGPGTKEYLESAWEEGIATFIGQSMANHPLYYDNGFTMDLEGTHKIGGHNEASVQAALWSAYKKHGASFKDDFWKAWTNKADGRIFTAWEFWDSWKKLRKKTLGKLQAAYKAHGMEYRYTFLRGNKRYKAVTQASKSLINFFGPTEFITVSEIYDKKGKTGGGTEADYKEEFYNENNNEYKTHTAGNLAAGSNFGNPLVSDGKKYIVPVRKKNQ